MERWQTLDVVKGIGLLMMTLVHTLVWWFIYPTLRLGNSAFDSWFGPLFIMSGLGVTLLLFSAGYSMRLAWSTFVLQSKGRVIDPGFILGKKVVVRSAILFLLAMGINVVVWGRDSLWLWNVLQFMALAGILIYILARIHIYAVYGVTLLSVCISFLLPVFLPYGVHSFLGEIIIGDIASPSVWPLLPWLCIPAFGYILAHSRDTLLSKSYLVPSIYVGGVMILFPTLLGLFSKPIGTDFEHIWDHIILPHPLFVMCAMGLYIVSLHGLEFLRMRMQLPNILALMGRNITLIYVVQLAVGFYYFANIVPRGKVSLLYFWIGIALQMVCFGVVLYIRACFQSKQSK